MPLGGNKTCFCTSGVRCLGKVELSGKCDLIALFGLKRRICLRWLPLGVHRVPGTVGMTDLSRKNPEGQSIFEQREIMGHGDGFQTSLRLLCNSACASARTFMNIPVLATQGTNLQGREWACKPTPGSGCYSLPCGNIDYEAALGLWTVNNSHGTADTMANLSPAFWHQRLCVFLKLSASLDLTNPCFRVFLALGQGLANCGPQTAACFCE